MMIQMKYFGLFQLRFLLLITLLVILINPLLGEENTADLLESAKNHFFEKRYNIALELFERVIQSDPENAEAYSFAGDIYLTQGWLDEAEERYRIAVEIAPSPARDYFRLGQTLYLKGDGKGALNAFRKSLELDVRIHINRFYLGLVELRFHKNKRETVRLWREYRRLVPDDPQGPRIDRIIEILERPGYKLKGNEADSFFQQTVYHKGKKSSGGCPCNPCSAGSSGQNTAGNTGTNASGNSSENKTENGTTGSANNQSANGNAGSGTNQSANEAGGNSQQEKQEPRIERPQTNAPYKEGDPEKEKQNNQSEGMINIDDL